MRGIKRADTSCACTGTLVAHPDCHTKLLTGHTRCLGMTNALGIARLGTCSGVIHFEVLTKVCLCLGPAVRGLRVFASYLSPSLPPSLPFSAPTRDMSETTWCAVRISATTSVIMRPARASTAAISGAIGAARILATPRQNHAPKVARGFGASHGLRVAPFAPAAVSPSARRSSRLS